MVACTAGFDRDHRRRKLLEECEHLLASQLQSFGHSVKLIAPQLVKPYVKRGKNDAADAEALCEAMSRPVSGLTRGCASCR